MSKLIKLTQLDGRPFYIRLDDISSMQQLAPSVLESCEPPVEIPLRTSVCSPIGGRVVQVRESPEEILAMEAESENNSTTTT